VSDQRRHCWASQQWHPRACGDGCFAMSHHNDNNTKWLRFPVVLLGALLTILGIHLVDFFRSSMPTGGYQWDGWVTVVGWLGLTLVGGPFFLVVGLLGRPHWVQKVFDKVFVHRRHPMMPSAMYSYCLPRWLHRIFNALFGCCIVSTAAVLALAYVVPNDWLSPETLAVALALGLVAGVSLLFLDPDRFSLVEGWRW